LAAQKLRSDIRAWENLILFHGNPRFRKPFSCSRPGFRGVIGEEEGWPKFSERSEGVFGAGEGSAAAKKYPVNIQKKTLVPAKHAPILIAKPRIHPKFSSPENDKFHLSRPKGFSWGPYGGGPGRKGGAGFFPCGPGFLCGERRFSPFPVEKTLSMAVWTIDRGPLSPYNGA